MRVTEKDVGPKGKDAGVDGGGGGGGGGTRPRRIGEHVCDACGWRTTKVETLVKHVVACGTDGAVGVRRGRPRSRDGGKRGPSGGLDEGAAKRERMGRADKVEDLLALVPLEEVVPLEALGMELMPWGGGEVAGPSGLGDEGVEFYDLVHGDIDIRTPPVMAGGRHGGGRRARAGAGAAAAAAPVYAPAATLALTTPAPVGGGGADTGAEVGVTGVDGAGPQGMLGDAKALAEELALEKAKAALLKAELNKYKSLYMAEQELANSLRSGGWDDALGKGLGGGTPRGL